MAVSTQAGEQNQRMTGIDLSFEISNCGALLFGSQAVIYNVIFYTIPQILLPAVA